MARVAGQKRSSRGIDWSPPESQLEAERTVFLTGAVTDELAESVICQLAWLSRVGSQPIALVINSPGGSVSAGLAIVDMMKGIECEVRTHALGMAASMAVIGSGIFSSPKDRMAMSIIIIERTLLSI